MTAFEQGQYQWKVPVESKLSTVFLPVEVDFNQHEQCIKRYYYLFVILRKIKRFKWRN